MNSNFIVAEKTIDGIPLEQVNPILNPKTNSYWQFNYIGRYVTNGKTVFIANQYCIYIRDLGIIYISKDSQTKYSICKCNPTDYEKILKNATFLDYDEIPNYKDEVIPKFSGKRIKRGLYRSTFRKINADVNGAYNIMVKENPNYIIGKREQLGFNPTLIKL